MEFSYTEHQSRTSSYQSSHTTGFDPNESFQRYHSKDESNPWIVKEEDEESYNQPGPYECPMEPQQESVPVSWETLQQVKMETDREKWQRTNSWLKQSRNAPLPPNSDSEPSSDDWNRRKLVPKRRNAHRRSVAEDNFNQDCRNEPKRNSFWDDEVPVPVRSPAWSGNDRQSGGQKRKWRVDEDECRQSKGQSSSWQYTKGFAMEDRRVQRTYDEDTGVSFTRYEESVYEARTSQRIRLAPREECGTEVKRQARANRFQRDELDCTLDEIITERIRTRKLIRHVKNHRKMYGSVTPAAPMRSSPPKLEMKPYDCASTKSSVRGKRRPIIIDGSNVAYGKTLGKYFDSDGIRICVDWFLKRGFTDIVVVVSEHRLSKSGCRNPEPLRKLQQENMLLTCWSRKLPNGRWVTSYDDRMIVEIAHKRGGIIISNDRFRDLQKEKPEWAETIGTRVVGFRFMPGKMDEIMFPEDPFGRFGPKLDELLRF